jgi:hypothetical protein
LYIYILPGRDSTPLFIIDEWLSINVEGQLIQKDGNKRAVQSHEKPST